VRLGTVRSFWWCVPIVDDSRPLHIRGHAAALGGVDQAREGGLEPTGGFEADAIDGGLA
jgi:hypothetical protein